VSARVVSQVACRITPIVADFDPPPVETVVAHTIRMTRRRAFGRGIRQTSCCSVPGSTQPVADIEIGGSARNGVGLHAHVRGSEMLTAISNAEAAHPNKLIAQAGNVP
jgi:hypothetical protein